MPSDNPVNDSAKDADAVTGGPNPVGKKEWTLMIYMAGDNNLSDEMIRAINDLRNRIETVGNQIAGSRAPYKKNGIGFLVEFDGQHPAVPSRRYNLTFDTDNPTDFPSSSRPVETD